MFARVYRYGFNGMEKDDEVSGGGNSYDFGARFLDPRLGRWLNIDPLAAKYPSMSPYNFVAGNPIIYIDPDGRAIKLANDDAERLRAKIFKSFGLNNVNLLFGTIAYRNGIVKTSISDKKFEKSLKKISKANDFSDQQIQRARDLHRILNSNDVVEIGMLYKSGSLGGIEGGENHDGEQTSMKFNTNNRSMTDIMAKNSRKETTSEGIATELSAFGGKGPDNSAFGVFNHANYNRGSDGIGETTEVIKGMILIYVPVFQGDFTMFSNNDKNADANVIKTTLDLFFEAIQDIYVEPLPASSTVTQKDSDKRKTDFEETQKSGENKGGEGTGKKKKTQSSGQNPYGG